MEKPEEQPVVRQAVAPGIEATWSPSGPALLGTASAQRWLLFQESTPETAVQEASTRVDTSKKPRKALPDQNRLLQDSVVGGSRDTSLLPPRES